MITKFEVKHHGKSRRFESFEEAIKFAISLEKLGYKVQVNVITYSLYTTITTQLYESGRWLWMIKKILL